MPNNDIQLYESQALAHANYDLLEEEGGHEPMHGDRLLMAIWLSIGAVFLAIFGWSAFAPLHKGVTAQGSVATESARQVIQHLDGGNIKQIFVKEGDTVKAGQILVELDPLQATTQFNLARQEYFSLLGERAMLQADVGGSPLVWPTEILQNQTSPDVKAIMSANSKLLADRRGFRSAQKAVLAQQIRSLDDQVHGLDARVSSINAQNKLIEDQTTSLQGLYEKGFAPKSRVLDLQRTTAGLTGDLGNTQAAISQAHTMMGEKRGQALQLDAQGREESARRLADVEANLGQAAEKYAHAQEVVSRLQVRSPVNGIVLERHIGTVGGVIRPGEPIMDIVPNDNIIVSVHVKPQDVESVRVGQHASIHFPGLNAQTTPSLDGKVIYVSADALQDQKTGQRYYNANVSIPNKQRARLRDVVLTPGMPADVSMDGGSRTALAYLLQPVTNAFAHSFEQ